MNLRIAQIITGPRLSSKLDLDEGCSVTPIGSLGSSYLFNAMEDILALENFSSMSAQLQNALSMVRQNADLASPIALISIVVECEAPCPDWLTKYEPQLASIRNALGVAFGEGFAPFASLMLDSDTAELEMTFPRPLGILQEFLGKKGPERTDPLQDAITALRCSETDERYRFLVEMFQAATQLPNPKFRVAHLFTCLEAMASGHFNVGRRTRDGIRMLTSNGYVRPFSLFQVGKEPPLEIDHIGLAGHCRHKLFHGIQEYSASGFDAAFAFFDRAPHLIAFALTVDCLNILRSQVWRRPAESQPELARCTNKSSYRFHFVTENEDVGSGNIGVVIRSPERAVIYIAIWYRDFVSGGARPFRIEAPAGAGAVQDWEAVHPGYRLKITT